MKYNRAYYLANKEKRIASVVSRQADIRETSLVVADAATISVPMLFSIIIKMTTKNML